MNHNNALTKWDYRFLDLAQHVAGWSKDPSTKVGAVIADPCNRIVSIGFNGLPRGVSDAADRLMDRETRLLMTLHAEENALQFANRSVGECTLYVWPLFPCANCASRIVQAGISRVVAAEPPQELRQRWAKSHAIAAQLYAEAGVQLIEVPNER